MNLGKVVATRGVADFAAENSEFATFVVNSLSRYIRGDWGIWIRKTRKPMKLR